MRLVIKFRKQECKYPSDMYIYIYGSDQVSEMHPPARPLQITLGGGGGGEGKKMCNLFRACLYFEEDILKQNRKKKINVRSDRYSFIN